MRLHRFLFVLTALSLFAFIAPQPAFSATHVALAKYPTRVAPADEYFGRLKMSILGIRNQLRDLEAKAYYRTSNRGALIGEATFIEDAMRDWSAKYPADPWIPGFRHRLQRVYVRIAALR